MNKLLCEHECGYIFSFSIEVVNTSNLTYEFFDHTVCVVGGDTDFLIDIYDEDFDFLIQPDTKEPPHVWNFGI